MSRGIIDESLQKLPTLFQGKYKSLGATAQNGIDFTLSDNMNNYKFLVVYLYNTGTDAAEATGFVPVDYFKYYNSISHAFGVNAYNNGRIYAYINYVSDTQVHTQLSSGRGVSILGLY